MLIFKKKIQHIDSSHSSLQEIDAAYEEHFDYNWVRDAKFWERWTIWALAKIRFMDH